VALGGAAEERTDCGMKSNRELFVLAKFCVLVSTLRVKRFMTLRSCTPRETAVRPGDVQPRRFIFQRLNRSFPLRVAAVIFCIATPPAVGAAQDSAGSTTGAVQAAPQAGPQAIPQATPADPPSAPAPQSQSSVDRLPQTKRILGIIPNFRSVSTDERLPPQTIKEKFMDATQDSFDYSSVCIPAVIAAESQASDAYPEFGSGAIAYGRYFWRSAVDQTDENYMVEFVVPVLTREDTRYYTLGRGGFLKRTGYALSRAVVTRSDSGKEVFNMSEVVERPQSNEEAENTPRPMAKTSRRPNMSPTTPAVSMNAASVSA